MLRLLCLLAPVFKRREAYLRLNEFAEERGAGEIIVFGYFFNGSRGIAQALLRERLFVHFGIICINIGGEAFAPYLSIPPKFLIRLFRHFECSDNHVGHIGLA